ncbi:inositol monophosphatase [Podospora conica]|nr:inositol monophosphatase [Schizothecium conicum]
MSDTATPDLQKIHDDLVALAFEAGAMILAANPSSILTDTKLNSADIVTETDRAVESLVSTRLATLYPSYHFVGEETYVPGTTKITPHPTFIVDPIDGTTNFVHAFPAACISLGFALARRPAVGVVYNPFLDTLYTGIKGRGAYMTRNASLPGGGTRTRLVPGRPLEGLRKALVAVEWGSQRSGENFELRARVFRDLTREGEGGGMVHSLRSLGSAALNICAVAAGQVDAYWEGGCYAWDVCAGWCILEEAGGRMVSGNPGGWEAEVDSRVYLAVRGAEGGEGQEGLVREFWGVVGGGRMDVISGWVPKDWDGAELTRCRARGTRITSPSTLQGAIHPIFHNWIFPSSSRPSTSSSTTTTSTASSPDPALIKALTPPLLLASRILTTVGLPWLSEFHIDDIFDDAYPGRFPTAEEEDQTPVVIPRHHISPALAAEPRIRKKWHASTARDLETTLARQIRWQLDPDMFKEKGWVGYTCRHRGEQMVVLDASLDRPSTIRAGDEAARERGETGRGMTVLVMEEYTTRMGELARQGREGGEEYLLTAFMMAVTMLHELGHAMYWRDLRAVNRRMTEPYFGGDLEMELGDSFVASLFGGWTPVPVAANDEFCASGRFEQGIAWRQHLTWDHHRARPRYRAHYSIPVGYVASLFDERSWTRCKPENLVRPQTLPRALPVRHGKPGIDMSTFDARLHASAALADFEVVEDGACRWRRRPAADFRIPLYRDALERHPWHTPDGCLLVPEEPRVHDKVLRQVQIRLRLPSSEIASRLRQPTSRGGRPLGRDTAGRPDNLVFHVGGVDPRVMTGEELTRAVARALGLAKKHVKLQLDGEGGREGQEVGSCILSAYARESEGGGLALRVSLDPDWESARSDCTLSCR